MKKNVFLIGGAIAMAFYIASCGESTESFKEEKVDLKKSNEITVDPWASNNGQVPSNYNGTLYKIKYDYPDSANIDWSTPWTEYLQGKEISNETAEEYMDILKERVRPGMSVMINDAKQWNETRDDYGWYGNPWMSQSVPVNASPSNANFTGREAISGSYTGQIIDSAIFTAYGLAADQMPIQNHALVFYNDVATQTLGKVWADPYNPQYLNGETQLKEGAIVIKAAGISVSEDNWPEALKGCSTFDIYRPMIGDTTDTYQVQTLSYIQFDIIVKDSIASPQTGWVFCTFIYDANSDGATVYDRFTLLGVQWGLDPEVTEAGQPLYENYINEAAPAFTQATLGFCGRLAGPIDIANLVGPQTIVETGETVTHTPTSSCLSCHGTAAYNSTTNFYPSPDGVHAIPPKNLYSPGNKEWMEWYVNKLGTETQSQGKNVVAVDYDFVMMFALGNWAELTDVKNRNLKRRNFPNHLGNN